MNQDDRRKYLIEGLLKERPEYENMQIQSDAGKQKILLRSLMNIRMPRQSQQNSLNIVFVVVMYTKIKKKKASKHKFKTFL